MDFMRPAEPRFRELLDLRKRLFPGDHKDVAERLTNLALLLEDRGELDGAKKPEHLNRP